VASSWGTGGFQLQGDLPEIVCLDLEATGMSSSPDHVIEIGAVRFRGSEVIGRYHTLLNPGVRLPPMIRRMTGISDRELAAAPRLRQVLPQLRAFIAGAGLLAHGAGYDIAFLGDTLGVRPGEVEVFDSLDAARVVCPGAPSYSLGALCDLVGLTHPRPHHALEDAEATFRLFLELVRLGGALPTSTLGELRRLTANSSHSLHTFFHVLVQPAAEAVAPSPTPDWASPQPRQPLMDRLGAAELTDLVGATGPLASEPGWELREVQQQMTLAVAQAFERRVNLVCEAGTGTGKSLAYLVPALAWAASGDSQVYISTYTINLQEQLLHKDLPLAARLLGLPLRAVLLKGRGHYLGRLRWEQLVLGTELAEQGGGIVEMEGIDPAELLIFKLKLTVWLSRTHTGDRDELRLFGQEERLWRSVASEWSDCRSAECLNGPTPCFYHRSRERAASADVVVVNHALLLADAFSESSSLGRAKNLVIDEAHHLEEAATKGLTEEVREDDLVNLLGLAAAAGPRGAVGPSQALARLIGLVLEVFEALRAEGRRAFGSELGRDIRIEPARWSNYAAELGARLGALAPAEAAVVETRLVRLVHILEAGDPERVGWAAFGRDGRSTVKRAPLDVGPILRESLIEGRDSIILTSATLAINGSFEYFRRRVGLPVSRLVELVLPSPFDFLSQALLCLPTDMPEPADPEFVERMVDAIEDIALRLRGRTLVLFTSVEQLTAASSELRLRLAPEGIEVLAQVRGAGSRRSLSERFISLPEAVLCGTNSFWEGLDLPGNALSCVVIARLPFAPPGEPVTRARSELLRDPFLELALPEAVLRLKQGFGRLIRRATDRGAVVILDPRVSTRAYGTHFIDALPECETYTGDAAGMGEAIQGWIEDRTISFSDGGTPLNPAPEAGAGAVRPDPGRPPGQPRPASRPG
jgi:DNA polymerase III epsilon subunit family exonuclease